MDDADVVQCAEPAGQLPNEHAAFVLGQIASSLQLVEERALQQLKHDVAVSLGVVRVEQADEIRVLQAIAPPKDRNLRANAFLACRTDLLHNLHSHAVVALPSNGEAHLRKLAPA